MAQETITRIVDVQVDRSITNVKQLKERISELRDKLVSADESSEEWASTTAQLRAEQERLNKVMGASKKDTEAVAGSYDALVKQMASLKKEWKATGDAIERAKLGEKIKGINDELKTMDASIGNYQRNVGSYEEALKNWTPTLKGAVEGLGRVSPAIGEVTGAVDSLDKAMGLMSANPAGAWLMGIVAVVQLFSKVVGESKSEVEDMTDSVSKLREEFDNLEQSISFDVRAMEALGKSNNTIREYRKEMLLAIRATAQEKYKWATDKQGEYSGFFRDMFGNKTAQLEEMRSSALALIADVDDKLRQLKQDALINEWSDQTAQNKKNAEASASQRKADKSVIANIFDSIFLFQMDNESREVETLSRSYEEKLELLRKYGYDTLELEQMRNAQIAEIRQKYREKEKEEWSKQFNEDLKNLEQETNAQILADKKVMDAKKALDALENARNKAKLQQTGNFLNAMSGLAGQSSVAGKSLAVASALISTYTSAQQAYQSAFLPIPTFSSPIIGALNMATAIASGMANVRQILSVDAENGESGASIGGSAVPQAPAVIQQSPVTRTITEGVDEDAINALQSTQRVVLVYSDVEVAGKRVEVQNNESSF